MEASGAARDEELLGRIRALTDNDYDLDGGQKSRPGAGAMKSQSENRARSQNFYSAKNICREIRNRMIHRSGEPLWKVYTPTRVLREIKHRLAKK